MILKQNPLLIRLFFFLIFVSATSVAYLLLPNEPAPHPRPPLFEKGWGNDITTTSIVIPTQVKEFLSAKGGSASGGKAGNEEKTDSTTTPLDNFQTASLTVNDQNYTLQFKPGENLLTAMRRLQTSSIKPFSFSGQEYAGLGFFVDSINDIKNNPSKNLYWIYYINEQSANIGVSFYLLKPEDIIKWKYENSTF